MVRARDKLTLGKPSRKEPRRPIREFHCRYRILPRKTNLNFEPRHHGARNPGSSPRSNRGGSKQFALAAWWEHAPWIGSGRCTPLSPAFFWLKEDETRNPFESGIAQDWKAPGLLRLDSRERPATSKGELMTGAYIQIKRNGEYHSVEIEYLTDAERNEALRSAGHKRIMQWLHFVCHKLNEIAPITN